MDSLLRWGLENSVPTSGDASELHTVAADIAAGKRNDLLDPGLYEAIMGKSDADLMKDAMAVAADQSQTEENRVTALDNVEMLIENIDNANNLANMKLWEPLYALLTDPLDSIRELACWVCGTAVQNNPQSQSAFLELKPIPTLLALISTTSTLKVPHDFNVPNLPPSSEQTRSRAIYCLSSTLKHNLNAIASLSQQDSWGWKVLSAALSDPSIIIRRKVAFLLSSLLLGVPTPGDLPSTGIAEFGAPAPSAPLDGMVESGIPSTLLQSLDPTSHVIPASGPNADGVASHEDADYREKACRVLIALLERKGLKDEDKQAFKALWQSWKKGGFEESVGLSEEEGKMVDSWLA